MEEKKTPNLDCAGYMQQDGNILHDASEMKHKEVSPFGRDNPRNGIDVKLLLYHFRVVGKWQGGECH